MSKSQTFATFDTVLQKIRDESNSPFELGEKFEKLVFNFLTTDKLYTKRFEKVWTWTDWAKENKIKESLGTGHDLGIDIVALEDDGKLCAIQCKCYHDENILEKKDVDSFVAARVAYNMDYCILVSTSPVNDNAMAMLIGAKCTILDTEHLRNSSIDWSEYPKIKARKPKKLRDYQELAMDDVIQGFSKNSRGKMIMACGTGKTLVSLHIAEKLAGRGGTVLYLVPSISLILQSMREWSENSNIPHYYMAVCSDTSIRNDDGSLTELETPASTDHHLLSERLSKISKQKMNVVFSTYHSIDVVMDSMKGSFDIVLCDEAHRTAGIEGSSGKESYLTLVHHDTNIKAKKRLYMTATPRIYTENVKSKARQKEKVIISMDDQSIYGPEFHHLTFYDAVHKYDALSDFKVRVAVMDGDTMDKTIQGLVSDDDNQIPLNEKTLMASMWHALEYPGAGDEKELLQRVIVFCDMINSSKLFAGDEITYKKDVRENSEEFERIKEIDKNRSFVRLVNYVKKVKKDSDITRPAVRHVDGGDNAQYRRKQLDWLRDSEDDPNICRMLSNARCLSEGVDVPALDGVVFMNPRKSVVDVVQAVGRVMRKSPGKDYGYVILPVAIPAGMKIEDALGDSKHFKVVWQVLNALRSHDSRFADEINKLILDPPDGTSNDITNRIIIRHAGSHGLSSLEMPAEKMIEGIATKLVEKVGDVDYYDTYGRTIGETTKAVETRIKNKLDGSPQLQNYFNSFHDGLKQLVNENITKDEALQIIGQHIVMSRVFDAMFSGEFTSRNPLSQILEKIAGKFGLQEELKILEPFYEQVRREIQGIKTREARQNFIKKIYGNFFSSAAKEQSEQHGIVYTPVEVIDFIINSVEILLKKHFGLGFNDRSVKVLEPFAGTGTFITRLLESGYIHDNLYEKYKHDIFANEMILLAYYIGTVNIETTYSSLQNHNRYVPFNGINYTDTIKHPARYREDPRHRQETTKINEDFVAVHARNRYQNASHLHVLMGNPPYSAGQDDFNKGTPNKKYSDLDPRIKDTYISRVKKINPTLTNTVSLYDSYIRSIRWASDRIGNSGIIGFITNASFIRSDATAGLRACLEEEFDEVWCFDLRGDAYTQGELRRKEGGNVFGSGSRTPVAITILIKNPTKKKCVIHYKDIGDYLTREQKLGKISELKSINGIKDWEKISPDKHHDWIDQRPKGFSKYTPIGSKETKSGAYVNAIFRIYSSGIKTHRDVWAYNSSKDELGKNMKVHINYCNSQDLNKPKIDPTQGKWTASLSDKLKQNKTKPKFDDNKIRTASYRPFFKQNLYFDNVFVEMTYQIPKFFPENSSKNLVICIPDKGKLGMFSVIVTDVTPDLHIIEQSQCFPLYVYENNKDKKLNITDFALKEYQQHYNDSKITKKSIFYYVYGILHHTQYKKKFANNLTRELPHIPMAPDFWKFSKAGERLADLHLNYETCKRYSLGKPKSKFGNLEKMAYPKMKKDDKQIADKTKLRINGVITYENIPSVKYQINGRTPLEWLIDRYRFTTDKDSGITNNPTKDMTEQKTIEMIERILYISTESDKIIAEFSRLPFEPKDWEPKKTGLDAYG